MRQGKRLKSGNRFFRLRRKYKILYRRKSTEKSFSP